MLLTITAACVEVCKPGVIVYAYHHLDFSLPLTKHTAAGQRRR